LALVRAVQLPPQCPPGVVKGPRLPPSAWMPSAACCPWSSSRAAMTTSVRSTRPPEPGQPLTEVPQRPRDGLVDRPGADAAQEFAVAVQGRGNVTVLAVAPAPTVQGRTDRAPHRGRRALLDRLEARRRGAKFVPFPDDPVGRSLLVGHVANEFGEDPAG